MTNKILCIGICSNPKKNSFTGPSVMFDGVVNYLKANNKDVSVIDISSRIEKKGTIFRSIDYLLVLIELLYSLCRYKYSLAYIVTSQSKKGFLRDNAMITLCRWFTIPVITHQYGANYHQLLDALGAKGLNRLKKMLGYVSTIIVEGNYMKDQYSFLPDYKTKVKAIPNGLPVEGKHSQTPKTFNPNKPFVLFYLSNLIRSKGYFDVLQAVDILINRDKLNINCVFAGRFMSSTDDERPGISNKEEFDKYIEDHNLKGKIEYFPALYGEEKDNYFYNSNVFLLPSYYINEGQPVSIIEAMAYGCVPIVTKYRHIPMMINEENGCFVEPKNPDEIAKTIKFLIDNTDIYALKSKKCISDYQQKFKFNVYVGKVMECIDSVIS